MSHSSSCSFGPKAVVRHCHRGSLPQRFPRVADDVMDQSHQIESLKHGEPLGYMFHVFPPYFFPIKTASPFFHPTVLFLRSCAFKVGATGRFEAFLALAYMDESVNHVLDRIESSKKI